MDCLSFLWQPWLKLLLWKIETHLSFMFDDMKDLATQVNRAPVIMISTWSSRNIAAPAQVGLNYVAVLLGYPFGTTITILFKVMCALLRKHSSWLIDFAHAVFYFKHPVHPHIIRRSRSSEVSFYFLIYYDIGIAAMIYECFMSELNFYPRKWENTKSTLKLQRFHLWSLRMDK